MEDVLKPQKFYLALSLTHITWKSKNHVFPHLNPHNIENIKPHLPFFKIIAIFNTLLDFIFNIEFRIYSLNYA